MTNAERLKAVMHYQDVDRIPVVHFGFWRDLVQKWAAEGHITQEEADAYADGNEVDRTITDALGFDFNYQTMFRPIDSPVPGFPSEVVRVLPDGTEHVRTGLGSVVTRKKDAGSIPAEVDHLLKDRASWEEHYKHRLQWDPDRVLGAWVSTGSGKLRFRDGGREHLVAEPHEHPIGLHCGSLYGVVRNIVGIENLIYLLIDDEPLLDEIIETFAELSLKSVQFALESGALFDFAHFWEDIAFKNGPLVNPSVFAEKVGPHYKRITDLVGKYGLDIVSVDCDGKIDDLVPVWLENGVNTMFPIEVGTWNASFAPWRDQYGKALRGVGGMNKHLFAADRAAIDAEIERLKPIVDLGGYIPCPDHRIPPTAEWDLIRYYGDRMRRELETGGGAA